MTSMGCPGALRLTCKGFAREWVPQSTTGASAKPNEASGSEMTVPRAAIPLLLGTVLVLAGLVVWRLVDAVWVPNEARDIAVSVGESSIVDIVPPTSQTSSNPRELAAVERPWKELPAKAVINSPNCILIAGTGGASGVAVVLAGPGRDAAWFAVVDEDGVLFGAHLDFGADGFPLFDLGRRPDGSVLMGFRTVDLSTQIFQDGQPIYEAEGVRNFDIASDGSSFLAIEPLAGGASRLVIRNFALGLELHHDLGDLPIKAPIPLLYSADGNEAIIRTGTTQRFYPVDGGEPREIRVPDRGPDTYTIPQSHEVGFRVKEVKDQFAKIARMEYRFGDNGREPATVEAWSRTFAHAEFGEPTESPFVSKDGAWVVLGFDRRGMVIDALTGETAVSVPFDEDARRARATRPACTSKMADFSYTANGSSKTPADGLPSDSSKSSTRISSISKANPWSACPSTRSPNSGTEDSSVPTRRRDPLASPYSLTAEHPRDLALGPFCRTAGCSSPMATA